MPFVIPNEGSALNGEQAELDTVDFQVISAGIAGSGVIRGCAVTQNGTPNLSVNVATGFVRVNGHHAFVGTATQNLTITTPDVTNPRFDLVVCDWNGTLSVTAGTPAAEPEFPAIPANSIVLAAVWVPNGATSILNANIIDKRVDQVVQWNMVDDFLPGSTETGEVGWFGWNFTANGTASISQQAAEANRPGITRVQTGTTSGNDTRLHLGNVATTGIVVPTNISYIRWNVRVPTITTYSVKVGIMQDVADVTTGTSGTAGAWFEHFPATNANWRCFTRQASTSSTALDTTVAAVANNWVQLEMVCLQNGNWQFALNEVLSGTISSNQPTTACNIGIVVETLTGAARNIDVDFFGLAYAPLGNRWT